MVRAVRLGLLEDGKSIRIHSSMEEGIEKGTQIFLPNYQRISPPNPLNALLTLRSGPQDDNDERRAPYESTYERGVHSRCGSVREP